MCLVSFRVYDLDGDGFISRAELMAMLKASLKSLVVLKLSEEQQQHLLEMTFSEVDLNGDGKISFDELLPHY